MDKTTYETYEYLPTNNSETQDEFFVVQDDGSYLLNRQVHYVTQVQETKELEDGEQGCTVYDVTPQFFVDVSNSSELISVSDQFIIPDAASNLYANSYLLQPGSSTTTDQTKPNVGETGYKPTNSQLDININTNKQVTNYTEITLNDEQYALLEQKGWILLEISDKVFVLDTMGGLRDVTENNELIQKLKSERTEGTTFDKKPVFVKVDNKLETYENSTQNLPLGTNTIQFVIDGSITGNNENIRDLPFVNANKDPTSQKPVLSNQVTVPRIENNGSKPPDGVAQGDQSNDDGNIKIIVVESDTNEHNYKENYSLRVQSKLNFKDIPEKIVLGKTVNGKLLVARIKKPSKKKTKQKTGDVQRVPIDTTKNAIKNGESLLNTSQSSITRFEEPKFSELFLQALQNNPEKEIDMKDVHATEAIISQLAQEPGFQSSLLDINLFVTKILQTEDRFGNIVCRDNPRILTGRVKMLNNQWRFIHIPNMLHMMMTESESVDMITSMNPNQGNVLHIQMTEINRPEPNPVKTSIVISKQNLPINFDVKKTSTVYACSACAALFKSEQELKEHHENQCTDTKYFYPMDMDIDKSDNVQCVMIENDKLYACTQCDLKFNKLSSCKKHMNTHFRPNETTSDKKSNSAKSKVIKKHNGGIYKCKMCPCTYYYASTLSKHIVTKHIIKVKRN